MAHPDTLYVLAAAYDDAAGAVEDYEAVKALYYAVKTSHDFDAAVIAKDDAGKVSIVKKHESRPGTARRWGSAGGWRPGWPRPCSRRSGSWARSRSARAAVPRSGP